ADPEAAPTAGQGRQRDGADRRIGLTGAPLRWASAALAAAVLGGVGGVLDRGLLEGGLLGGILRLGIRADPALGTALGPLLRCGPLLGLPALLHTGTGLHPTGAPRHVDRQDTTTTASANIAKNPGRPGE